MALQWPLIVFTLCLCLGAGIWFATGLMTFRGEDDAVKMPGMIATAVCLVVGGFASFLHLHHWERMFNGFGHITSGITHELIGIVVVMATVVLCFALFRAKKTPKWMGAVSMAASVLLIVLMTHSYAMPARPVWDVPFMYVAYLGNMGLFGFLALWIIQAATKGSTLVAKKAALVSGAVQLVGYLGFALVLMGMGSSFSDVGYHFMSSYPNLPLQEPGATVAGFATGEFGLAFWCIVVLVGSVLPMVVAGLGMRKEEGASGSFGLVVASLVGALAGGLAFRMMFFLLGYSQFVFY